MISRLIRGGAAVHKWPFPTLDADAAPEAVAEAAPLPAAAPVPLAPPAVDPAVEKLIEERTAAGYAEGLRRGLDEGREQGRAAAREQAKAAEARLAAQTSRLGEIARRLGQPIPALQRAVEEAVAALALEVARCVIGGEVSRSHAYLVRLIREAIAKVPIEMGAPKVLLNPGDLDLIRELAPDLDGSGATLIAEDAVEAGGCLVVADGEPAADRRWHPRTGEGVSQVNLTLASRWRSVILALFDGEEG